MSDRLTVTDKHFDDDETQELFIMFLKANDYKVGDKVEYFSFRKWISKNAREYRELNEIGEMQNLMSLGTDHYLDFYRSKYRGDL